MISGQSIAVVMPAYRAAKTLRTTYEAMPLAVVDHVLVVDDASDDEIAVWLTNEGETDQPNLEDSTVVPRKPETSDTPDSSETIDATDYSRHPHAEAAAEIIRKHWQTRS